MLLVLLQLYFCTLLAIISHTDDCLVCIAYAGVVLSKNYNIKACVPMEKCVYIFCIE